MAPECCVCLIKLGDILLTFPCVCSIPAQIASLETQRSYIYRTLLEVGKEIKRGLYAFVHNLSEPIMELTTLFHDLNECEHRSYRDKIIHQRKLPLSVVVNEV